MKQEVKLTVQLCCAVFLVLIGCALLIAGFIVDPMGIIHGSVLTAFGETCTFAGALFGLEYRYNYRWYRDSNKNTKEDKK